MTKRAASFPTLDAARRYAQDRLRFTAAESIKQQGSLVLDHRIQIEDGQGNVLHTVRVGDVVQIEG